MENCPARHVNTGQVYPDCVSDRKSRFWQFDHQPIPRSEVICPQPRRAARVPYFADGVNRLSGKPKGILPMHRVDCVSEILDLIMGKDDPEGDLDSNNQSGYFCGSPPVRTNNPLIHDVEFTKQTQSLASLGNLASSLGNSPGMKQSGRVEIGSPTCGSSVVGSPKVRIVGFSCGNSDSNCIVPTFA